jgi:hypothetical protein
MYRMGEADTLSGKTGLHRKPLREKGLTAFGRPSHHSSPAL